MDKRTKEFKNSQKEVVALPEDNSPKVVLTYAEKSFTETIGGALQPRDVVREMEAAKKNGQMWTINDRLYNLSNVYRIEFLNRPKEVVAPVQTAPAPAPFNNQPDAEKYKNVFNG